MCFHYAVRALFLLALLLLVTPIEAQQTAGFRQAAFGTTKGQEAASIVCIDPGHAKATVGASGKKLAEYRVCWLMAQKLKAQLEQRGVRVLLTKRSQDADVSNERRAEIANDAHADLLLRLHCDAGRDSGIATFFPDRQGVRNGVRGPSREVIEASRQCATVFHAALLHSLNGALPNRGIRPDAKTAVGSQQGGALTGSIYSHVPVLLVEMAVITNPRDEAFLASRRGQDRLAQALTEGTLAVLQSRAR